MDGVELEQVGRRLGVGSRVVDSNQLQAVARGDDPGHEPSDSPEAVYSYPDHEPDYPLEAGAKCFPL